MSRSRFNLIYFSFSYTNFNMMEKWTFAFMAGAGHFKTHLICLGHSLSIHTKLHTDTHAHLIAIAI